MTAAAGEIEGKRHFFPEHKGAEGLCGLIRHVSCRPLTFSAECGFKKVYLRE